MPAQRNALAALALAALFSLSACGGGGSDGAALPTPTPDTPTAPSPNPNVGLTASGPSSPVASGTFAGYVDLSLTNTGGAAATGVVLTLQLGSSLSQGSASCTATGGAVCPASSATALNVGTLPAGGALAIRIPLSPASGTSGVVSATATATSTNTTPAQRTATFSLSAYAADVRASASVNAPRVVERGTATYTMVVTNAGPDAARDVEVTSVLDSNQALGGVMCTASGGAQCPSTLGATMTAPLLPKDGSLTFAFPATVPVAGANRTLSSTMTVRAAGDPVASNNSAAVSVLSTPPNTIRLQSDQGDYIGGGNTYNYSRLNSDLLVQAVVGRLEVRVRGNENWDATFQSPSSETRLKTGTYTNLTRYPFHVPAVGGLNWSGEGRGCNMLRGSFTVTDVQYVNDVLDAITMSFEQYCEGGSTALRGQLHWTSSDTAEPEGPQPVPANLWQPPANATPATGSYVYLQSDPGDYIGLGQTFLHTRLNSILVFNSPGAMLTVRVDSDGIWSGEFAPMRGLSRLQPGYYSGLQRFPFHNPVSGGLSWSGYGRGCNTLIGWFAVDSISYRNNTVTAVELRFEQRCEGMTPSLRGKIRLVPNETSQLPPGPVNPPPSDLWVPPANATPSTGNYVYLQSDPGDYIGGGQTRLYTPSNSTLVVTDGTGRFTIDVGGYRGNFQAMLGVAQLEPGYYGDLRRWPFHNPAKGGLDWSGQGVGCNMLSGWFVVDSATYDLNGLQAISLRFQQNCEMQTPALRGKIVWRR